MHLNRERTERPSAGWMSGGMGTGLRVVHRDDLVEVVDGSHQEPLLSLSTSEAADLVENISAILDIVGWPS